MRRLIGSVLVLSAVLGASGCGGGGGSGDGSTEGAVAAWPGSVDSLDLVRGAPDYVAAVRSAVSSAGDVQVRRLTRHGGVLATATGVDRSSVPDVVFLSRDAGYTAAEAGGLRQTVLRAVIGVAKPAGTAGYSALDGSPFTTADGVSGGTVRTSGATPVDGTWCAFAGHGVAVVVLATTLSREQDEQLAAKLAG